MKYRYFLFVIILFSQAACQDKIQRKYPVAGNHYALGFAKSLENGINKLSVKNPWENASDVSIEYYLIDRDRKIPDSLAGKNIVRTPVERIICLSTSHLAFLDALGELDKVTGISGSTYITNPGIRQKIKEGKISDVGYGQNLNYEEIIRQKPDMVMVYGVDSEIAGFLGKFRDLKIPAVIIAEYLETTPLGKAEWLKFVAAFFNKELLADSLFKGIEKRYRQLVELSRNVEFHPVVMVGLPYRDAWWIPGGKSYMAQMIADAGGKFVASENPSHESFVISMEDALNLSSDAGIWLNTGMITKKSGILETDPRFVNFPLFMKGRIYNNNRGSTPAGGVDFWESGTVHPDIILSDLIRIFHPALLPVDTLHYYREIK
jgi:iron complex transport system substrate-binding protein